MFMYFRNKSHRIEDIDGSYVYVKGPTRSQETSLKDSVFGIVTVGTSINIPGP